MHSPFDLTKPVAIGSDHAGYDYKEQLISFLEGKGIGFKDFGTHSKDSVDYPDFAHPVALAVESTAANSTRLSSVKTFFMLEKYCIG